MELFIFIITIIILAEVTFLLLRLRQEPIFSKHQKRKVYVDTSALIDGRILSIAQTGFVSDDLIIPRSVIRELQLLADGKDSEKRRRARFGMDIASELERVVYCNVEIFQDALDRTPVDERLIQLAKTNRGAILTNDYNLSKVAATEKIDVLNVNDLSLVLRSEYYPGQHQTLQISTTGSNPGQGVGHFGDGTMVVVDSAAQLIGQNVEIEIIRLHQTSAGRMIFAKLASEKTKSSKPRLRTPRLKRASATASSNPNPKANRSRR